MENKDQIDRLNLMMAIRIAQNILAMIIKKNQC